MVIAMNINIRTSHLSGSLTPRILKKPTPGAPKPPEDNKPGLVRQWAGAVGGRLAHGTKNAGLQAGFTLATTLVPLATTAAVSALMPATYVQAGGMFLNMAIGGAVGASMGGYFGVKSAELNGVKGREADNERFIAAATGGAFGAFSGFLGSMTSPAVTVHDPALVSKLGLLTLGTGVGTLGTAGFVTGVWNGPPKD